MKCSLLCLGLILVCTVAATGQPASGLVDVSGTVIDVNGEVVAGARVILS